MNINAYLKRINYDGSLAPTATTLRALQVAHLLTVPFENLSIHAGEPIVLNDEALFEKIVTRRRGGFCYECNGLFAALLRRLRFDVDMMSAEVANADGTFSDPFDHMTLLVKLEQRWLVDVGFGDSFLEPLLLDQREQQEQGTSAYRIETAGDYFVLARREKVSNHKPKRQSHEANWKAQYRFTLQPYGYADFAGMCRYHQTSPQSHFTRGRICSRATEGGGRISLSATRGGEPRDMRLISTSRHGEGTEKILQSFEEYNEALRLHFGVVMRAEPAKK